MVEHIIPDAQDGALGYIDHDAVVGESRQDADRINARHDGDRMQESRKIRRIRQQQGTDIAVDERLHEHRAPRLAED